MPVLFSTYLFEKNFPQAAQDLESRIKKMTEIYSSGIGTLKDLAHTLHIKASSNMEHIQSKVLSQTLAVENVSHEILFPIPKIKES